LVDLIHALSNPPQVFQRLGATPPRQVEQPDVATTPHQLQHHLTDYERVELLERYLSGERAFQLAEIFNINRRTVADILVKAGVRRPRSMTAQERKDAVQLYADGWSCARIGEELGRNHGTVWLALQAAGVALREPWEQ
jgi:DNA-directed RNA polymerase specialized sigma24 family protein